MVSFKDIGAFQSGSGADIGAFESEDVTGTNMQINISDAWKIVDGMQINIGNAWKTVDGAQINIGDSWKTIF